MTFLPNVGVSVSDGPSADAFQRFRVSNPITLFDSSFIADDQPLIWERIEDGTGTSTRSAANAMMVLAVPAAGDRVVCQSKKYVSYQPGKSN